MKSFGKDICSRDLDILSLLDDNHKKWYDRLIVTSVFSWKFCHFFLISICISLSISTEHIFFFDVSLKELGSFLLQQRWSALNCEGLTNYDHLEPNWKLMLILNFGFCFYKICDRWVSSVFRKPEQIIYHI